MKYIILLMVVALGFTSCKVPEARRPVSQKTGSYIDQAVARNKKIVAAEEEVIREIIQEDSTRNYISSAYGFWYYYNKKDSSSVATPEFGDVVEFDYNIETLRGQPIYSEEELSPKTYVMDREELFSGLREGLRLMREGETVTFLFPSHKAFGFYGDRDEIGRNIPIRSTVTLKEITKTSNNQNQD